MGTVRTSSCVGMTMSVGFGVLPLPPQSLRDSSPASVLKKNAGGVSGHCILNLHAFTPLYPHIKRSKTPQSLHFQEMYAWVAPLPLYYKI